MRFLLGACLTAGLLMPLSAPAQEAAAPASEIKQIKEFEKAERLRDLRHKHLWLAYAAAWLVIFGFVWRTHRMSKGTDDQLQALKRKIEALEGKQDG